MDPVESTPFLPIAVESGPHQGYLASLLMALMNTFARWSVRINAVLPKDGTESMTAPIVLNTYTVATRPTASDWTAGVIYVSDGGAGAVIQASNGSAWVNLG